jgi:hypothetical protein
MSDLMINSQHPNVQCHFYWPPKSMVRAAEIFSCWHSTWILRFKSCHGCQVLVSFINKKNNTPHPHTHKQCMYAHVYTHTHTHTFMHSKDPKFSQSNNRMWNKSNDYIKIQTYNTKYFTHSIKMLYSLYTADNLIMSHFLTLEIPQNM